MARPDPIATPDDLAEAMALLTRLPARLAAPRGAASGWAWPVVGALVGALAALVGGFALSLGLPLPLVAVLVVLVEISVTGGLHEDGLSDVADGFWGGADKARRLEIMKDSRVGSYGVLALVLVPLARVFAVLALLEAGALAASLIAAGALSRAPMTVLMAALPNARGAGLSDHIGRPHPATAWLATGAALLFATLAVGGAVLAPVFWVALTTIALAAIAKAKIGGQTGDVLGASQQLAQLAALTALASVAGT